MSRILITRPLPDEVMSQLDEFDVTVRQETGPLTVEERQAALRDFDGVLCTLGDNFSEKTFADVESSRCKILANFGVGYNHIDVGAAKNAGLIVTNTPGAVTDATADIAMTLMLMATRRAGEGERLVRSGQWEGWHPTQMLGLHVSHKTIGILGMGRIGQAIARRAHFGFGMHVHYASRSAKSLPFPAQRCDDAVALAASVDVLVAAVPGSSETRHLVNAEVLEALGPQSYLINISRGDVVDEAALIAALQDGRIGGAGLDVYEFEPTVPEALRALDNVVLLPHLGTSAHEVRVDMGLMAVENLKAFFAGNTPPNPV